MELLSVIRRWHHREYMPIQEIERRTGLSRNTIRKYLRAAPSVSLSWAMRDAVTVVTRPDIRLDLRFVDVAD